MIRTGILRWLASDGGEASPAKRTANAEHLYRHRAAPDVKFLAYRGVQKYRRGAELCVILEALRASLLRSEDDKNMVGVLTINLRAWRGFFFGLASKVLELDIDGRYFKSIRPLRH